MSQKQQLDQGVRRFGFWSAVVSIITLLASFVFPLDVPNGYLAEQGDRVTWLVANRGAFITGWVNQILAMFSLSAVFACSAWQVAGKAPIRFFLAMVVVLLSVVAFIIPKFMAVWTIPLLAETLSTGSAGAEMANGLLPLLNVSIPFSLYTSFDYLGFWLYAVFALVIAKPLWGRGLALKVAALSLGLFGCIFHVLLLALWFGQIAAGEIETYFLGISLLLVVHVVLMGWLFRGASQVAS